MRRILKWFALSAAVIVVVLIALLLSLPLVLDSESFKSAALRHLSRATGGQWQVARLDFTWLPLPKVSIQGASFDIPGSAQGKVEALTLTTALLPLLWGDVRVGHVALVAPDVTVTIAPSSASSGPSGTFTVSDLRAALSGASQLKAVDLQSLDVVIERGRFVLVTPGQPSLTFSGINGWAANHSGRIEVQLTTASDLAQRIDVKINLDVARFEGGIQVDASGIDLGTLLAVAGAQEAGLRSSIALRANIKADRSPALKGTFEASANSLSIDSSAGKLALEGVVLDGEAIWTDAGLQLVGRDVHTASPAVQATAVLTFSPDWNQQHLETKVERATLETVKQLALPWTTGTPEVAQYAQTITAGELTGVQATLQLDQLDHWQKAIEAHASLSGASMTLQRPALPIRDLNASLALVQGKLQARDLKAVSGNSSLREGRIDLDFTTMETVLSATARWQADLAQALALTRGELAPGARAKLDTLRALTGEASGSVTLDGTFDRLQVNAQVEAMRAQASLEPLPWPLTVTDARMRFDGNALEVQGLAGRLGDSGFNRCNGRLTLAGTSQLQVSGCEADLALVELFGWASKRFPLPPAVKELQLIGGRASVQVRTLAGALATPANWAGDVSVTPRAVRLTHPELPGELRLDGGSVRGDLRSLTAQGIKAEVLDAALQLSGSVSGLGKGVPHVEVQGTGPVGEKILAWRWDRAGLGDMIAPVHAFEARGVRVKWPAENGFETAGELVFDGKTTLSYDALVQVGSTEIRRVAVRDEQSNMQMALRQHKGVLEGSVSGTLTGASLERIVQTRQSPQTRASGDLKYRLPLKRPRDFSATGTLQVNQLTAVGWGLVPRDTMVKSADIRASGRALQLVTSFSTKQTDFDVSGTIRATARHYVLDLDVQSQRVDLRRLLPPRERSVKQADAKEQPQPKAWDLPVEGRIRLAIDSLRYGSYRVAPLYAALDIAPDQVDVSIREAKVCGIGVTGGGRAQPASMSLDVVLQARDIDPEPTSLCLTRERTALTGSLNADAHLTANGPYSEIAHHLQGPFQLVARDGRVDRMTGLAQIFNLINASELLRGKRLGLNESGFAYSKFVVKGTVDGTLVRFDEAVLDAQPFDVVARGSINWLEDTVDMNVAVAPLQALNTVVKFIPLLGYWLGGGVYAVPVGVRGSLSNPQVVPVAPSAVAGSIFGMLERTLKSPFNLREALIPPIMQTTNAPASVPAAATPAKPSVNQ